jgi:peptide/nickel transport system permease protein
MGRYILRRLFMGILMAWIASTIVFMTMRLLPGDPIELYVAQNQLQMTEEHLSHLRHQYFLDRPLIVQYGIWLNGVLHGNMGFSIYYHENVRRLLAERLPVTLNLGLISWSFAAICGIALGICSAIRRGHWGDAFIRFFMNAGTAVPVFWLGVMMIYIFGLKLRWLPIGGYTSPVKDLWLNIRQIAMPAVCLSIPGIAVVARQMRASLLEVIRQDYIRTAWAKGMTEKTVIFRHALKNGIIPVLTILGASLGMIMGGAVIIETIFAIPGIGRLMASSVLSKDYVVIQSITLILGLVTVSVNLLVDIAYSWCDPRVQYS